MKKLVAVIAVIVIIVIAWLAFGSKNNETGNSNQPASTNHTSQNQSPANSTPEATNQVTINNFAFTPADITVKKGTKVTWTNQDSTTHTVTEADGKTGPDSQTLANGQSYSFTYDQTGTFSYHCSIHPEMTGTVTVTE